MPYVFTVFPIVWAPGSPVIVMDTYFLFLLLPRPPLFLFKIENVDTLGL